MGEGFGNLVSGIYFSGVRYERTDAQLRKYVIFEDDWDFPEDKGHGIFHAITFLVQVDFYQRMADRKALNTLT